VTLITRLIRRDVVGRFETGRTLTGMSMTLITPGRRASQYSMYMTFTTVDIDVGSEQGEPGQQVIEILAWSMNTGGGNGLLRSCRQQNPFAAICAPRRGDCARRGCLRIGSCKQYTAGDQQHYSRKQQTVPVGIPDQFNKILHDHSSLPHHRQIFYSSPGCIHMTAFTILAETAIVNIVLCMTIVASARQANLFHNLGMALGTLQSPVLARQRKTGLATVIESPILPTACTVTGFTFNAQSSPMVVVLSVTTYTGNRCVPECFGLVARLALHLYMFAQ